MNIHYRYSKIFEVNFYEFVCAILTLSGIDITMVVMFFFFFFFFITATVVQWCTKNLAKWSKTGGMGADPPAANGILRFSYKKKLI